MALKRYIIERDIPGAGNLSQDELKAVAQKSCSVLDGMGSDIRWVHSYVTGDRVYCFYEAADEERIRQHAREGGFPANRISEVAAIIDPSTASG
ncbi:MAG TPA: DUF4242 domain-containing protein [Candidatus Tumulicola sp.]|nr:DUF4242 domain-containing protein [Candidatus Tumulicola sp.]